MGATTCGEAMEQGEWSLEQSHAADKESTKTHMLVMLSCRASTMNEAFFGNNIATSLCISMMSEIECRGIFFRPNVTGAPISKFVVLVIIGQEYRRYPRYL